MNILHDLAKGTVHKFNYDLVSELTFFKTNLNHPNLCILIMHSSYSVCIPASVINTLISLFLQTVLLVVQCLLIYKH